MEKTTAKIFKKGSLDFKGPIKIDSIQTEHPVAEKYNDRDKQSVDAKATIVENHEDFSIIEVICSCGEKLYLKCNHPQAIKNR